MLSFVEKGLPVRVGHYPKGSHKENDVGTIREFSGDKTYIRISVQGKEVNDYNRDKLSDLDLISN
jgi:hypothetical protein